MSDLKLATSEQSVGPVLQTGSLLTEAIVQAIRELNHSVEVTNRGAYLRVMVANECRLTAAAVERLTGRTFHLPGDLESVMSSFKGKISITREEVIWKSHKGRES